jgi:Pyruvate/2-oxoacid:ferredoxin oxidoreductase delta subunit
MEENMYYFSGTGNAKNCSQWIINAARDAGMETELVNITQKPGPLALRQPGKGTLIGFCSPTHGFNYPLVMRKFIRQFPRSQGADVILLNTRAGWRIFNLILPGLSGIALHFAALVLSLKGYRIRGLMPVDLPSNWLSLHPAMREKGTRKIYANQETRVQAFTRKVLAGKTSFRTLRDILQDIAISPIAILYNVIGRFFIAKSFYADRSCRDCGLCIKRCPVKAIKIVDGRMFWKFNCESCMKCMNICPVAAIQTGHGMVALAIALSILGTSLLVQSIAHAVPACEAWLENIFAESAIFSVLLVPAIGIVYRILHFLMKFRAAEKAMTLTSLTHYKIWGRYAAPKVNALGKTVFTQKALTSKESNRQL